MGTIFAQTNSRISAKPKIRVLDRFKAQDLKIGSFVRQGSWTALIPTGAYRSIQDHTRPYSTIEYQQDHMGPYWTIQDHMRPYRTIQQLMVPYMVPYSNNGTICDHTDYTGPQGTIRHHTGPYSTIKYQTVPYGTSLDYKGPYRTIRVNRGSQVTLRNHTVPNRTIQDHRQLFQAYGAVSNFFVTDAPKKY